MWTSHITAITANYDNCLYYLQCAASNNNWLFGFFLMRYPKSALTCTWLCMWLFALHLGKNFLEACKLVYKAYSTLHDPVCPHLCGMHNSLRCPSVFSEGATCDFSKYVVTCLPYSDVLPRGLWIWPVVKEHFPLWHSTDAFCTTGSSLHSTAWYCSTYL